MITLLDEYERDVPVSGRHDGDQIIKHLETTGPLRGTEDDWITNEVLNGSMNYTTFGPIEGNPSRYFYQTGGDADDQGKLKAATQIDFSSRSRIILKWEGFKLHNPSEVNFKLGLMGTDNRALLSYRDDSEGTGDSKNTEIEVTNGSSSVTKTLYDEYDLFGNPKSIILDIDYGNDQMIATIENVGFIISDFTSNFDKNEDNEIVITRLHAIDANQKEINFSKFEYLVVETLDW